MFNTLSNTAENIGDLVQHTAAYLTTHASFYDLAAHTPLLESRMIVCHVLGMSNTELFTHPERIIPNTTESSKQVFEMAQARCEGVPLAYLMDEKEFYGYNFVVTPDVLIPRPETESIVDLALDIIAKESQNTHIAHRILDCGTGSGCIGISLALQHTQWEIILSDIDGKALALAEKNSLALLGKVLPSYKGSLISHMLEHNTDAIGIIIANLPYVCPHELPYTQITHEPAHALSDQSPDGLALISQLITQSNSLEYPHYLILEIDPLQVDSITRTLAHTQYTHIQTHLDLSKRTRFISCANKVRRAGTLFLSS